MKSKMKEHLKTVWTHLRRSPYQALAAISIMSLTLFVTSIFVLLAGGSQSILRYFETRPQATAFFKDEVTVDQVNSLTEKLKASGKVEQTKFISKDEALKIYQQQNKNDPLLLEMVTAEILPASLEVSVKDLNNLPEIVSLLRQQTEVEEVVFQQEVTNSLKTWTRNLRLIGIGIISFLALVSLLIILVIIGMKVALHHKEIEVMQLIGATNWYIRAPFVIEGVFYGLIGAVLAWGFTSLLLLYLTPFLVDFFKGIPLLPISPWLILGLLGGETLLAIIIGLLGSLLAVKRFLH